LNGINLEGVWIGLTDVVKEGTFVWIDDSPMIYSNWAPGEPNNGKDADHTWIYGPDKVYFGYWDDLPENTGVNFLCEQQQRTIEGN